LGIAGWNEYRNVGKGVAHAYLVTILYDLFAHS
jgi:hypothetical protein